MDEIIIKLVEEINKYSIDDIREKIRTKIYKEIEKLRKDDVNFSDQLGILENNLWRNLTKKNNLRELILFYNSLEDLKYGIEYFKNSVNTN